MTAFGRGEATGDGYRFTVELRTLNHRFCDIRIRLPRKYSDLEEEIKRRLSSQFSRGRIEASIVVDEALDKVQHLKVDEKLANTYKRLLLSLKEELGLEGGITLETLLNFRDIFVFEEDQEGSKQAWRILSEALGYAVNACTQMRQEEGAAIKADLSERLRQLETVTNEVKGRAPAQASTGAAGRS